MAKKVNMGSFQPGVILPDFCDINFMFTSVEVIEKKMSPKRFPVVILYPKNSEMQNKLINELGKENFDPVNFFISNKKFIESQKEVEDIYSDFKLVVELVKRSILQQKALIFSMQDKSNPMCEIVLLLPNYVSSSITVVFIELKDRIKNNFEAKLDGIAKSYELMLAPIAQALSRVGIQFDLSIYLCCGRSKLIC
jgi:hypothetical protein